jgi:hypothetical protein
MTLLFVTARNEAVYVFACGLDCFGLSALAMTDGWMDGWIALPPQARNDGWTARKKIRHKRMGR